MDGGEGNSLSCIWVIAEAKSSDLFCMSLWEQEKIGDVSGVNGE